MEAERGCGVLFFSRERQSVLLFRRDNVPSLPFPGMLDILGGHLEEMEDPETALRREMAEELHDRRTTRPYELGEVTLFREYTGRRGIRQSIYCAPADFDIEDVDLLEGQYLVWLSREDAGNEELAFEFEDVARAFFDSPYMNESPESASSGRPA